MAGDNIELDFTGNLSDIFAELRNLRTGLGEVAKSQDTINNKFADMAKKGQQASATMVQGANQATQAAIKRNGAYQQELGIIGSAIARLRALEVARDRSNNTAAIDRYNRKIKETQDQITILTGKQNQLTAATKNASSAAQQQTSAFEGLRNAAAAYLGLNFLQTQGAEVVDVTAKFQGYGRALKVIFGSQDEAAAQTAYISEVVKRFGLELESTTQAYVKFAGASKLSGLTTQQTQSVFTNVSSAVSALGLSADDANGVFLALGQIISKGTVQAEELRGQIGERLPGAFAIAADAIGVTQQELNKMLQNGEVLSKDFLPKFSDELGKRFSGAADDAAKSANNLNRDINKAKNAFTEFRLELGNSNGSLLSSIFGFVTLDNLRLFVRLLVSAVTAIASYKAATVAANAAQSVFKFLVADGTKIMLGFNAAIAANPVGLFATLISTAASAISFFAFNTDQATSGIDDFTASLEANTKAVEDQIKRFDTLSAARAGTNQKQIDDNKSQVQQQIDNLNQLLQVQKNAIVEAGLLYDANKQAFLNDNTNPTRFIPGGGVGQEASQVSRVVGQDLGFFQDIFATERQINSLNNSLRNFDKQVADTLTAVVNYSKLSLAELEKLAEGGDKLAKAEIKRREDNLKKYQDLLKQLVDARKKASLDLANDDEARVRLEKQYRDEDIKNLEDSIKKFGKLSVDQVQAFNDLRLASEKQLTADLLKIYRDRDRVITSINEDSVKKAREEFELDLRDKADTLRKAGVDEVSIRAYNDRELKKFNSKAALERLAIEEDSALTINELIDRSAMSEKNALQDKEQAKLSITIEYAKRRLAILQSIPDADQKEINSLKVSIKNATDELAKLESKPKSLNVFELFGLKLDDNQQQAILTAFKEFYGSLSQIAADSLKSQIDANNALLSNLNSSISQTQQSIATALELQKQGYANNLTELQATLEQQQEARRKALEEQKRLQRQQLILDSITQGASLVTASANIFKALSPLGPAGVVASVATIGAMFAAFLASKAQAAQAINNSPVFEEGGTLPGPSHKEGGLDLINPRSGQKIAELEGGEFLNSKKTTNRYGAILEALNNNRPGEALRRLRDKLAGKDFNIERIVSETRNAQAFNNNVNVDNSKMQRELSDVKSQIAETNRLLKNQTVVIQAGDKTIIKKGNKTRIIRK